MWWLLWAYLAYEKPSHHAHISDAEFEFMTHAQGNDVHDYGKMKVPWKSILTSLPVTAMCLCYSVTRSGLMLLRLVHWQACLTNIVMAVVSGILTDFLLNKKYLTTTVVRKILIGVEREFRPRLEIGGVRDIDFVNRYRVNRTTAQELVELLGQDLARSERGGKTISPETKSTFVEKVTTPSTARRL
ncbi:hypothetical protein DPMN_018324 [Dreissena polymorpha]|uniref:Uncharacterized protein n=1 Tax=Dreissena polymorpha TaxID=45954 RepID=A0A9D4S767_DREPO|nr:hypothetical protein DPMN_018324 [Dreissena polymorpha]